MAESGDATPNRQRAKRELAALLAECLDRLGEAKGDPTQADFFGLSARAAESAAVLGYPVPPIEYVVVRRPDHHRLLEANPHYSTVQVLRVNDHTGLAFTAIDLSANADANESAPTPEPDVLPPPDPAQREQVAKLLRSWHRAVDRIDLETVQLTEDDVTGDENSFQRWVFNRKLEQELRGGIPPDSEEATLRRRAMEKLTSPECVREVEKLASEWSKRNRLAAIACTRAESDGTDDRIGQSPTGLPEDAANLNIESEAVSGAAQQQSTECKRKRGKRMKREVTAPLIAEHLTRRPHDTAQEVSEAVRCSVGVVAESKAWELNQRRLKIARKLGADPKALRLTEKAVNAAGGSRMTQLHEHGRQTDAMIDELDQREQELNQRIGEYLQTHPGTTAQQVAAALDCTAGDVERRQGILDRLADEQAKDEKEDADVEDPHTKRGKRRKWVKKQV